MWERSDIAIGYGTVFETKEKKNAKSLDNPGGLGDRKQEKQMYWCKQPHVNRGIVYKKGNKNKVKIESLGKEKVMKTEIKINYLCVRCFVQSVQATSNKQWLPVRNRDSPSVSTRHCWSYHGLQEDVDRWTGKWRDWLILQACRIICIQCYFMCSYYVYIYDY